MTDEDAGKLPTNVEVEAAVQAQLEQVRVRLVREGVAMGLSESVVIEAIDDHAERYGAAQVRSFVGVLVERAVRQDLSIRRSS